MLKITNVVREEMDTIGQEFLAAGAPSARDLGASGRWQVMGDNMFRLKDRKGADLCLGMTHEEVMTEIARKELRSYKQLPQIWYQIQNKFRDEPRPKSGLLRVRQFTMKDSYSFDIDAAGLDVSYQKHYDVYRRIFDRCGLKYVGGGGALGRDGRVAVAGVHGEHRCGRRPGGKLREDAATRRTWRRRLRSWRRSRSWLHGRWQAGAGAHAGQKTIEEWRSSWAFRRSRRSRRWRYMAVVRQHGSERGSEARKPVTVFLRGDHTVNEAKLPRSLNGEVRKLDTGLDVTEMRPMPPEEAEQ